MNCCCEVTKLLLDLGACALALDDKGRTPLFLAVKRCNYPAVRALIDARPGASNVINPPGLLNPLAMALENKDSQMVRLLIDAGAEPCHALMRVVSSNHQFRDCAEKLKLLASCGVNLSAKVPGDVTIVHVLASLDNYKLLSLALELGASANDNNNHIAESPLHTAADNGCLRSVKLLLRHGANVNAKDIRGWTPLRYAELQHNTKMMYTLRRAGGTL